MQFQPLPSPRQVAPVACGLQLARPRLTLAPRRRPPARSGQPWPWPALAARASGPPRLAVSGSPQLAGWRMGDFLGLMLSSICASARGVKMLHFHCIYCVFCKYDRAQYGGKKIQISVSSMDEKFKSASNSTWMTGQWLLACCWPAAGCCCCPDCCFLAGCLPTDGEKTTTLQLTVVFTRLPIWLDRDPHLDLFVHVRREWQLIGHSHIYMCDNLMYNI